jgi:protein phosphatase
MSDTTLPTLYCTNLKCRASNTELDTNCHQCGAPLLKRYLWVLGATGKEGETLGDRYVFRGPRVVLDTQVGLPLRVNTDLPNGLIPYLKLFPHRLHLSQLYTALAPRRKKEPLIVLLEQAPLSAADFFEDCVSALHPSVTAALPLTESWPYALPLRQVNWLWQMAQLWHPLAIQGVASSLVQPNLLRVEERFVRLLELQSDLDISPTLSDLGTFWQQWLTSPSEHFAPDFEKLCQALIQGSIATPELLLDQLEQLLLRYQEPYTLKIDISARTDTGQMRDHNEDACYPEQGVVAQNSAERLAIVCDGVGGHDGGEVASGIAIEAMTSHLIRLQQGALPNDVVISELEAATFQANDLISARNDEEQREDRRRMGTTLVTTLIHNQQAYITHIGDSRAYLITALGCYQLTIDDDIACREVRLGYVPYREALQQPASGSLTQALGMASSSVLRPSIERLILDEDCVLLLCSDGLSDYDRVESLWSTEILPLLHQETDLVTVTKNLIDQANQLNGHDNITVAVLHCRVDRPPMPAGSPPPPRTTQLQSTPTLAQPSVPQTYQDQRSGAWKIWAIAGFLVALALGGLAYFFRTQPALSPTVEETPAPADLPTSRLTFADLKAGQSLEIQSREPVNTTAPVLMNIWVQDQPPPSSQEGSTQLSLPAGKLITVLKPQGLETEGTTPSQWVKVRVCPAPVSNPSARGSVPEPDDLLSAKETSQALDPPPAASSPALPSTAPPTDPQKNYGADKLVEGWVSAEELLRHVVDSAVAAPVCGSAANTDQIPSGNATLR